MPSKLCSRRFWLWLPILVEFFLASAPVLAETAVLVAVPTEFDGIRKEVRLVGQKIELTGHRISIGYRKGEKIFLVKTGAGNLNSAMLTQALLTRYKIDGVISIGIAGNLNDSWKVGGLLIATNVVNHQEGKETPSGFEVKEVKELAPAYLKKCEKLESAAVEVATILISNASTNATTDIRRQARNSTRTIRQGRIVSGDSFIASSDKRKWLRETFHADAVDMVSAGIARVCEANGVPYVIIRALSDNADESASADFAAFVQKYKEPATASIAVGIIDRVIAATPRSPAK
jgi:adenosylhomocysteine nucleosidase